MRNAALLGTRLVIGGYLVAHGAQKMFGILDGPGLDNAAKGFASMGLSPAKPMATLAAVSEIAGGAMTAAGIANPVGPVLIGSAMATASAVHLPAGPMGAKGGYEQTATYLAAAVALGATGGGKWSLTKSLPTPLASVFTASAAAISVFTIVQIMKAQRNAAAASQDAEQTAQDLADNEAVVDVSNATASATN